MAELNRRGKEFDSAAIRQYHIDLVQMFKDGKIDADNFNLAIQGIIGSLDRMMRMSTAKIFRAEIPKGMVQEVKDANEINELFKATREGKLQQLQTKLKKVNKLATDYPGVKTTAIQKDVTKELSDFIKSLSGSGRGKKDKSADQLASAIRNVDDEIKRLTLSEKEYEQYKFDQKIAEYKKLGVAAERLTELEEAHAKALNKKTFTEAERELQEFNKTYANLFKNISQGFTGNEEQIKNWRKAAVAAFGAGTTELATFEQRLAQVQERMREEASTDFWDGARPGARTYSEEATNAAKNAETALTNSFSNAEDTLVRFTTTGKMEFKDLVNSILSDLARLTIRQGITGPLFGALGGLFGGPAVTAQSALNTGWGALGAVKGILGFSQGNVFRAPALSAYSNTIVDRPTIFPFARGIGLMGEAGAEAIMPLTRTSRGDLGVRGTGVPAPTLNVTIQNHGTDKSFEVQQLSPNEVRIIARDEARTVLYKEGDRMVASSIANPNSDTSRSMGHNTQTKRRF